MLQNVADHEIRCPFYQRFGDFALCESVCFHIKSLSAGLPQIILGQWQPQGREIGNHTSILSQLTPVVPGVFETAPLRVYHSTECWHDWASNYRAILTCEKSGGACPCEWFEPPACKRTGCSRCSRGASANRKSGRTPSSSEANDRHPRRFDFADSADPGGIRTRETTKRWDGSWKDWFGVGDGEWDQDLGEEHVGSQAHGTACCYAAAWSREQCRFDLPKIRAHSAERVNRTRGCPKLLGKWYASKAGWTFLSIFFPHAHIFLEVRTPQFASICHTAMIAMIAMKQSKQTWGRQEVAQAEAILAAVTEAISSIESSERAAVIFRIFP